MEFSVADHPPGRTWLPGLDDQLLDHDRAGVLGQGDGLLAARRLGMEKDQSRRQGEETAIHGLDLPASQLAGHLGEIRACGPGALSGLRTTAGP